MLSFRVQENGSLQICCDHDGMAKLLEKLAILVREPDHVHLWAPPLGEDLSQTTPFGEPAIAEVIIDYSPDYP